MKSQGRGAPSWANFATQSQPSRGPLLRTARPRRPEGQSLIKALNQRLTSSDVTVAMGLGGSAKTLGAAPCCFSLSPAPRPVHALALPPVPRTSGVLDEVLKLLGLELAVLFAHLLEGVAEAAEAAGAGGKPAEEIQHGAHGGRLRRPTSPNSAALCAAKREEEGGEGEREKGRARTAIAKGNERGSGQESEQRDAG